MAVCGIYKITNKETGECYIGQSTDIYGRWKQHSSNKYKEDDWHQNLQKYPELYTYDILVRCNKEDLDDEESYYIYKYDSVNKGYNKKQGNHSIFKELRYEDAPTVEKENLPYSLLDKVENITNIITFNPNAIFSCSDQLSSMDTDVLIYYIYTQENNLNPSATNFANLFNRLTCGDTHNRYKKSYQKLCDINFIDSSGQIARDIISLSPYNINIDIKKYTLLKNDCSKYSLLLLCIIEYLKNIGKNTISVESLKQMTIYNKIQDINRFVFKKNINSLNKYYYFEEPIQYQFIRAGHKYDKIKFIWS